MRPTSTVLVAGLALLASAGPGLAETLFVTDITTSNPLYRIEVPTVEVTDGNIDEATVRALFSGDAASAAALGSLDAAVIRIPWISMRSTLEGGLSGPALPHRPSSRIGGIRKRKAGPVCAGPAELVSLQMG